MLVNNQHVVILKSSPDPFKIRPGDMLWAGSLCGRNTGIGVQEDDQRAWNGFQFGHRVFNVLGPLRGIEDGVPDSDVDANGIPEATDTLEIREMFPNFFLKARCLFRVSDYQLHLPAVPQIGNLQDSRNFIDFCEMNQTTPLHSISAVTIPNTSHG